MGTDVLLICLEIVIADECMIRDKHWSDLLNATPIPTIILKANHPTYSVVFVNEAYLSFINSSREEIIGNSLINLLHAYLNSAGIDEVIQILQDVSHHKVVQKQSIVKFEFKEPQTGDVTVKYVDVFNTPFLGEDNKVEFIIRTINDVTEIIEAQQREMAIHDAFEKELTASRNQYQALIESVEGVVWEADANTFEFTYISSKINDMLGYTPEQWLSDPNFWANHIYEDDREWAVTFCKNQTQEAQNHIFDYRMIKADGAIVWVKDLVSVIEENGKPKFLRGVMLDVTESKLLANLDHLEKNVLELVANKEKDLHQILVLYMKGIENMLPHMKCSILQVENNSLYTLAAPSLPKGYNDAIDGIPIGPQAGSCGTSAYLKKKVIVADILTSPLWENYKHLAFKYNLRACWSCPIINSDNVVTAVFGMYYDHVKEPTDIEQTIIERSVAILKVILENRQRARIIEEATMLMTQGQELANFGNWQWDIKNNTVKWSDVLYDIYGVDKQTHVANYESYLSMLHPDDREFVQNTILTALSSKEDVAFEERIIRPNGEMRYLKSWGRVLCDNNGNPEKMIGSCLDVTAAKMAETQLWEISWRQSHLVRAPLARLMGLVDILKEEQSNPAIDNELLNYILDTAYELDKVINEVSNKAY
jgi:PAS domain S-box-containing protein